MVLVWDGVRDVVQFGMGIRGVVVVAVMIKTTHTNWGVAHLYPVFTSYYVNGSG